MAPKIPRIVPLPPPELPPSGAAVVVVGGGGGGDGTTTGGGIVAGGIVAGGIVSGGGVGAGVVAGGAGVVTGACAVARMQDDPPTDANDLIILPVESFKDPTSVLQLPVSSCSTREADHWGAACRIWAAAPETMGVTMEVPDFVL